MTKTIKELVEESKKDPLIKATMRIDGKVIDIKDNIIIMKLKK